MNLERVSLYGCGTARHPRRHPLLLPSVWGMVIVAGTSVAKESTHVQLPERVISSAIMEV